MEGKDTGRWVKKDGHWQWQDPDGPSKINFALLQKPDAESGDRWGDWVYSSEANALTHREYDYQVQLEKLVTAESFTEWIAHLCEKTWLSSAGMGDFIKAVDYLIGIDAIHSGHALSPADKQKH
ncbi:MAG TPA: hypothetical protein VGH20_06385 [Myxococcales bacterium]|jgi:hypothetical protein